MFYEYLKHSSFWWKLFICCKRVTNSSKDKLFINSRTFPDTVIRKHQVIRWLFVNYKVWCHIYMLLNVIHHILRRIYKTVCLCFRPLQASILLHASQQVGAFHSGVMVILIPSVPPQSEEPGGGCLSRPPAHHSTLCPPNICLKACCCCQPWQSAQSLHCQVKTHLSRLTSTSLGNHAPVNVTTHLSR